MAEFCNQLDGCEAVSASERHCQSRVPEAARPRCTAAHSRIGPRTSHDPGSHLMGGAALARGAGTSADRGELSVDRPDDLPLLAPDPTSAAACLNACQRS